MAIESDRRHEINELLKTMQMEKLEFRLLGIACCKRIIGSLKDKRLLKALKHLEESVASDDDRIRQDAYNGANSVYRELCRASIPVPQAEISAACTVVCAAVAEPNLNMLGNFGVTLQHAEKLSQSEITEIEIDLLNDVLNSSRRTD